ncbi:TonB C-terminal domain-containing protein [bacterium]|nr:TonB C-terminal domain-containing protein [bacterium]
MVNNNSSYFYISGLVSSVILFLVLSLFSYVLFSSQQLKSYALKKDTSISVSIVNLSKKTDLPVNEKNNEEIPSTEISQKPADVSSLFSKVWTKSLDSISKEKQNTDNDSLLRLTKKIKTSTKNDVQSIKEKVENTKFARADVQVTSDDSSTGEEVNEFLAKIQGEIYNNFYPPQNTGGQSAKILIRLDADGTVLDFRILTYSGDDIFNAEVDRLKNRVSVLRFPQNPDNKAGNYIITLVAKE